MNVSRLLALAAAALFSSFLSGGANAVIIYDNGGPDQVTGLEVTAFVEADNFSVAQDVTLTDAHFWAFEHPSIPWDGTLDWYLFADASGQPASSPLASGSGTNVSKIATGNLIFGGLIEYEYDFDLDTPVDLIGGADYWFALHLSSNFDRDEIYWETSGPLGNNHHSLGGTFDNWSSDGFELAFYLTAVPEPASLVLLGTGLVMIRVIRRG